MADQRGSTALPLFLRTMLLLLPVMPAMGWFAGSLPHAVVFWLGFVLFFGGYFLQLHSAQWTPPVVARSTTMMLLGLVAIVVGDGPPIAAWDMTKAAILAVPAAVMLGLETRRRLRANPGF